MDGVLRHPGSTKVDELVEAGRYRRDVYQLVVTGHQPRVLDPAQAVVGRRFWIEARTINRHEVETEPDQHQRDGGDQSDAIALASATWARTSPTTGTSIQSGDTTARPSLSIARPDSVWASANDSQVE